MANLFIGLGGSGVKTIRNIKNLGRKDDYFLVVDSAENEIADFEDHEVINMSQASVSEFLRTSKSPTREKAKIWLDPAAVIKFPDGPLKDGASANRPLGRTAVTQIYKSFEEKISGKIKESKKISNKAVEKLQTYVVFSVAGGTGSSIFLDLNQKILENLTAQYGEMQFDFPQAIIYMPTFFVNQQKDDEKNKYYSNVFACWKEIDGFQRDYLNVFGQNAEFNLKTNFHRFAIDANKNMDTIQFNPFKYGILFDHEISNGTTLTIDELYSNVGRYISIISNIEYGSKITEEFNNNLKDIAANSFLTNEPWVRNYLSAGYQEIRGGSDLYKKYISSQIRLNVFQSLKGNESNRLTEIHAFSNKLIKEQLLSRIDDNDSFGYENERIISTNDELENLHNIIDNNYENIYKTIFEKNRDTSITTQSTTEYISYFNDTIVKTFEKDLRADIKINGFDINKCKELILSKIYKEINPFVFENGLIPVQELLKDIDSKIDILYTHYDTTLTGLANESSDENVPNNKLLDEINSQNIKIDKGPGTFTRSKTFYNDEITKLHKLIICYVKYCQKLVSLELKRSICLEIGLDEKEMETIGIVKELILKLNDKITGKEHPGDPNQTDKSKRESLEYLASNSLISEYSNIKNNNLTSYIPDVSKFVNTKNSFEDESINKFKYSYLNECGFEIEQVRGVKTILRRKTDRKNSNSVTLQCLLDKVLTKEDYHIEKVLNKDISVDNFISTFSELVEKNLINCLRDVLKGKYSEYANKKINDWIKDYQIEFDQLAVEFKNKVSIFSNFRGINTDPKTIWLTPDPEHEDSKKNIKDLNTKIDEKSFATTEDAIIQILYKVGLSIEEYVHYPIYEKTYKQNILTQFPHIDVRFKNLMIEKKIHENLELPIGANWICDKIIEIGNANKSIGQAQSTIEIDVITHLERYANCIFISYYYDKLWMDANLSKEIFKVQDDYKRFFDSEPIKPPIYINQNELNLLKCNDFDKYLKRGFMNLGGRIDKKITNILDAKTIEDLMFKWMDYSPDTTKDKDWEEIKTFNLGEHNEIIKLNLSSSRNRLDLENIIKNCIKETENHLTPLLQNLSYMNKEILKKSINNFVKSVENFL
jgi:hypothetical protein